MKLRHFVLSLAAVFLALAGGVVLGARLLSEPVVTGLRGDNGNLEQQVQDLQRDNATLDRRLAAANEFDTRMSGRIVKDVLAGKSVVVFRTPDAADADVEALGRLTAAAGGSVTGTLTLTSEFVGGDSGEKLRSVVNSPIVPAGAALSTALLDPHSQAGDLLGIALLDHRDPAIPPVDDTARDTVLTALSDTGFLAAPERIAPADVAVVVTGGALADDAGNQGATVARFAAGLAPHGSGVVLAGRDGADDAVSAVAVARAEPDLSAAVTTVDDIGSESGRITTMLALRARIDGAPVGSYGVGPGADAVTVG